MMKSLLIVSALMVLNLFSSGAFASYNNSTEFLQDVKDITSKCVVMHIGNNNDHRQIQKIESVCAELKLLNKSEAQILVEGQWFLAKLSESEDSDGGDLDNLAIINSAGKIVATRTNVPAFDNVVIGMLGGDLSAVRTIESTFVK